MSDDDNDVRVKATGRLPERPTCAHCGQARAYLSAQVQCDTLPFNTFVVCAVCGGWQRYVLAKGQPKMRAPSAAELVKMEQAVFDALTKMARYVKTKVAQVLEEDDG